MASQAERESAAAAAKSRRRIAPLVLRRQWRARGAKEITPIEARAVRFLVVHYTAMNADEQRNHRNCAGRVRGIELSGDGTTRRQCGPSGATCHPRSAASRSLVGRS